MEQFEVGIVGAGYVGLVTGACLAHLGHRVTLVDANAGRVSSFRRGRIDIHEPGLEDLVAKNSGRLDFTTRLEPVVREADVVFIAVDTPPERDGSASLSNVARVARAIGGALADSPGRERPLVVVNKSTVPVGSGDYVSMLIRDGAGYKTGVAADFEVVSNPEFLREGSAIHDSLFPDRIVLGTDSATALDTMRGLFGQIIEQSFPTNLDPRPRTRVPLVTTDLASSEMIKYAANAFLATKISFINEISNLCELAGADVESVAAGIGLDGRIGPRFLNAGIGWGGSCLPKDVAALRAVARELDYESALLNATVTVNDRQRKRVISKLQHDLHTLKGKKVALLGLAFKPDTDDLRGAPSLEIAAALDSLGASVVGYDPVAGAKLAGTSGLRVVTDPYEALQGAHAAVVVTEWMEVRTLDLGRVARLMDEPKLLVDGRNALDPRGATEAGLLYRGFGRA